MEASAVRDWASLPGDLLGIIATHVLKSSVEDFTAFRGVCYSWRSDLSVGDYSKPWPSIPYLMLQGQNGNGKHEGQRLYSLTKRKICRTLSLPEIAGKHCVEARFGWLLTADNSGREVKLLNPFSRSEIELPNFENISPEFFFLLRAVLSKNPAEKTQFVLVVLIDNKSLVFWRKGDRNWTRIESLGGCVKIKDVNYSNRDRRFYVIGDNGNIWGWGHGHHDDFTCTKLELMFSVWLCYANMYTNMYSNFVQAYLMESTSDCVGELYLVTRYYSCPCINNNHTSETNEFKIFKFGVETVGTILEEIKRLENEAIFVGPNAAICIAVSGATEPNCIYFLDGWANLVSSFDFAETREVQGRKRGVYHLQNESIEWFDDAIQEVSSRFPPLWIAPSHFS